ncbi:TorF family putative porin [Legionella sp. km772]|uniref:TorF family putative porin n=1 Tax=Legionella sp. km772 TaxID=2498111 RepID=UPI00131596D8|nr:TorF family putative porin [Legionella sp. km772]
MSYYQLAVFIFLSCMLLNLSCAKSLKVNKKKPTQEENSREEEKPHFSAEKLLKPLTGSFDISSNYIFRGISFSSNLPAFQGGLSYLFPKTGLYVDVWGSNVKFYDFVGNTATVEPDLGGGIRNTVGTHFSYDFSWIRYSYPKAYQINFDEFLANFQYFFISSLIGYTRNYFGTGGQGTYTNIGINYDIPPQYFFNLKDINLNAGIGYYYLPELFGNYADYKIQLGKTIKNYKLSLQWTDTNHKYNIDPNFANSKITAMIQVSF